jgi:hypothetical protein
MDSLRFSRGEYWLLEAVATYRLGISDLFRIDIGEYFNKPGHGLKRREVKTALLSLKERHLIEFLAHGSPSEPISSLDAFSAQATACYGLTPEGGKQWEAFAAPNWDAYFDFSSSLDDAAERIEICGQNEELLNRYYNGLHFEKIFPIQDTVQWTISEPWQATYWKELQRGFWVKFDALRKGHFSWDSMPLNYYWLTRPRWYRWG